MPTYEYKCTECGERFEIQQSMSDEALTSLEGPDHEHQLKKVFTAPGIVFKGSGFYKNDARPDSTTKPSSTVESSESKPATKIDAKSSSASSDSTAKKPKKDKASAKPAKST